MIQFVDGYMYISVNSLIQQINTLESELGFLLLNRSQRGIQLTPSGQMFLTGAKSITADMDILIKQCSEYAGKGMVTIGFPKGGRFLFINRILEKCSEECPEIKLTFISSPEGPLQSLLNRNLDIQIFPGIPSIIQNPSLQFDTLFYSKLCCVYNSPSDFPDTAVLRSSYFRGMDVILDDSEWKELIPGICKVAKCILIAVMGRNIFFLKGMPDYMNRSGLLQFRIYQILLSAWFIEQKLPLR